MIDYSWHLNLLLFTTDIKSWYQRWHWKFSSSLEKCLGLQGLNWVPCPGGVYECAIVSEFIPIPGALHRMCICLPRNEFWHCSDRLMMPLLKRLQSWRRLLSLDSWWLLEVRAASSSSQEELFLWNPSASAWSVGLTNCILHIPLAHVFAFAFTAI